MKSLQSFEAQGFLAAALDRARRRTDAPREFHIYSTLAVLGAAAQHIRIPYFGRLVPPSLWVVLVAPSAFYRKTTAIELARSLLLEARPQFAPPIVYRANAVLHSMRSPEKLLVFDDFSHLLYPRVAERLIQLHDAAAPLSMLAAASTPTLSSRLVATDVTGGMLSRFSFVVAARGEKRWLSRPASPRPESDTALAAFLKSVANLTATASFEACSAEHRAWGEDASEFVNRFCGTGHEAVAAGFASRLELTLMKLAALLEISRHSTPEELEAALAESAPCPSVSSNGSNAGVSHTGSAGVPPASVSAARSAASDGAPAPSTGSAGVSPASVPAARSAASDGASAPSLVVTPDSFTAAATLVHYLRDSFGRLLDTELRSAAELNNEIRVVNMLRRTPGISRNRLLRNSHVPAAELNAVIDALKTNGSLKEKGNGLYMGRREFANVTAKPSNGEALETPGLGES